MLSDLAIRFDDVGKEYRVASSAAGDRYRYKSLGERVGWALRHPLRATAAAFSRPPSESFWALRDVSFQVSRGEVIGVIGRNGAGKSTLLKVLSQITRPTTGQIEVHGRVGSLLEVGTGFHPELTGRENVFLNGAILGMTRREIRARFDEIVAFSEVERFLDTPVKQYSSGMYTRLAFAVAAHLDPEVLVVDEVLAVGDAEFQKKCLGKMQDVASGGRTVLFVSHNMGAIRRLCATAVVLDRGRVKYTGQTDGAIEQYLQSALGSSGGSLKADIPHESSLPFYSHRISVSCKGSHDAIGPRSDAACEVAVHCRTTELTSKVSLLLAVFRNGVPIWSTLDTDGNRQLWNARKPGECIAKYTIPPNTLKSGVVTLHVGTLSPGSHWIQPAKEVITFEIGEPSDDPTLFGHSSVREGAIYSPGKWEIAANSSHIAGL